MTMDYNAGNDLSANVAACQTALATLQRLGQTDQADAPLTDAEKTSYDAIVNDPTRSQAWIIQTCAQKYIAVIATLAGKLTAAATSGGRQDSTDAAAVFGIAGLPGDVASLAISRRDAGDRVAAIEDTTQLQALLATAVRNGDTVLAHAIAEAAINSADVDTAQQFADAYPALADAVQRLWTTATLRTTSVDITTAWRLSALKPSPISSLMDYEIATAATGNANAGAWNA